MKYTIEYTTVDCHCVGSPFQRIPLLISSTGPTASRSHQATTCLRLVVNYWSAHDVKEVSAFIDSIFSSSWMELPLVILPSIVPFVDGTVSVQPFVGLDGISHHYGGRLLHLGAMTTQGQSSHVFLLLLYSALAGTSVCILRKVMV